MEGMDIDVETAAAAGEGHPPFDLAQYASNYTGHTQVSRLLFIVDNFPDLASAALAMAVKAIQQGHDTCRYQQIMSAEKYKERLQALDIAKNDKWLRDSQKESDVLQGQLESRVNSAKNSNDTARIWGAYIGLGDFWYERGVFDGGDIHGARSCYFHAKDHATETLFSTWCLSITRTYLMMGEADAKHYQRAINFSTQVKSKSHANNNELAVEVHISEGLFHLHNYLRDCDTPQSGTKGDTQPLSFAATHFIKANFEKCDSPGSIISKQDLALYASLCALASFSRAQLNTQVVDNLEFQKFLALVPDVKALVDHLLQFRYAEFISTLDTLLATRLPYDMHLSKHASKLCAAIRGAAMVQYASPYTRILIANMAAAFGCEAEVLEDDLIILINNGKLNGRIDSYNQVYVTNQARPRAKAFKSVLDLSQKNLLSTDALLLRASCLEHGMGIYHAAIPQAGGAVLPLSTPLHAAAVQGEAGSEGMEAGSEAIGEAGSEAIGEAGSEAIGEDAIADAAPMEIDE